MNLFQIDQAILGCVDEETGEVLDMEALESLQMERDKKIENVALWIKELKAETKALQDEKNKLAARIKAKENRKDNLSRYLLDALQGKTFETTKVVCKERMNPESLAIIDEMALREWLESEHDECLKHIEATVIKDDVATLIKQGVNVPGAELIRTQGLNIK